MAPSPVPWQAQPHGSIRKLEENLWMVEGDVPGMALKLGRVMTVFRLTDGRLVIHSAIAMDESSMRELEAWGRPAFVIVPNGMHRIDAPRYKTRYPDIQVIAPAESHKQVEAKVAVDGHLEALPKDPTFEVESAAGMKSGEPVMISRTPDGRRATIVFCDAFFNVPHIPGFWGSVYKFFGQSGKAHVPGLTKLVNLKDRGAFKAQLERLAGLDHLVRIVPGHGQPVEQDPAGALRQAAAVL